MSINKRPSSQDKSMLFFRTRINPYLEFSFYLFIISIPFEALILSSGWFESGILNEFVGSLSRITGILLIITSLFNFKNLLNYRSSIIISFYFFIMIYFFSFAINIGFFENRVSFFQVLSIPWLIILFSISSFILRNKNVRNHGYKLLMVCIGLTAFIQVTLSTFLESTNTFPGYSQMARLSIFGNDLNLAGGQYAVGLLLAMLIIMGIISSGKILRASSWVIGFLCLIALVQTGSRGAVISFILSLLTWFFIKGQFRKKIIIFIFLAIILVGLLELILTNEGFKTRFMQTIEYGDTSNRLIIYTIALKLIKFQPLIGYGPFINSFVLGAERNLVFVDTHNTFLWVLTATGLLGFIPFVFGLILCGVKGYKVVKTSESIVPFSLFSFVIIFSQTVAFHQTKIFWLILAFSTSQIIFPNQRKTVTHDESKNS